MHHSHTTHAGPETRGRTIRWARIYDALPIWGIATLGKGARIREEMLDLAGLKPGDSVLDVGCGPGALTLKAGARVGSTGETAGIDASPEMIAVAREKAQRAGVKIDFRVQAVERMSFPDDSFDVVLSSLMMHHLPDDVKQAGLAEIRRVLKPGGRLVILDFIRPETSGRKLLLRAMFHQAMPVGLQDLEPLLREAGFERIELQPTQIGMFGYLRGEAP